LYSRKIPLEPNAAAMVCGSFPYAGNMVAAPQGIWAPVNAAPQGIWAPVDNSCAWGTHQVSYGFNAWIQPSMTKAAMTKAAIARESNMMQCKVNDSPRSSGGASTSASITEPRRQTAARAAKRQRGRERRKMYKAAAHDQKLALGFEARAAAVSVEVKLVVDNNGFFDVEFEDSSSSDEDIALPPAIFRSTTDIDMWRRDYRRFRLGDHRGAKGEVTSNNLDAYDLSGLSLRSGIDMPALSLAPLPVSIPCLAC